MNLSVDTVLAITELLRKQGKGGELRVRDISTTLGCHPSTVSMAIGWLRKQGVAVSAKRGQSMWIRAAQWPIEFTPPVRRVRPPPPNMKLDPSERLVGYEPPDAHAPIRRYHSAELVGVKREGPSCVSCAHYVKTRILGWSRCEADPLRPETAAPAMRQSGEPCGPQALLFRPALRAA